MKTILPGNSFFRPLTLAVLAAVLMVFPAFTQTLIWNNGSGNRQWDVASQNWLVGGTPATWNNAAAEDAIFGPTGVGTVNLTTGITADSITFNTVGYTIASSTLTLTAPSASITNNADATISSSLAGASGLTKAGSGTLTLSGSLNYNGTMTITAGQVVAGDNLPGSVTSGTAVNVAGGALQVNYANGQNTEIYDLTGAGTFKFDCAAGGTAIPFYNPDEEVCTISMSAGGLFHVASGTMRNAWGHGNIWDNNRSGLQVDSGATFDLWDSPLGIGYCFDALNGVGTIQSTEGGNPNNLIIGLANGSGAFDGVITDANNSPITLTKSGSGTQILSGTCTYSGPTIVSGGTLELDGRLGSASTVTVNTNATLDGSGTIGGPVTITGGELAVGANGVPGTLTLANTLTLNAQSTAFLRINKGGSPANDRLAGLTTITYGGTLTVTNLGGALALGDTFTLFQSAFYLGGFSSLNLPPLPEGLYWNLSQLTVNGAITVTNRSLSWTATILATSANPSLLNTNVQLTAVVQTNGALASNAGGIMVFYDNGMPLSTNSVLDGQAVFTTSALTAGFHLISANYSGDATYCGSASVAEMQVVEKAPAASFENDFVRVDFNARGLETIYDKCSGKSVTFNQDEFYVAVGGATVVSSNFTTVLTAETPTNCTYRLNYAPWTIQANYQLQPNGRFVSKQISISTTGTNDFTVNEVNPMQAALNTTVAAVQPVASGQLVRFNDGGGTPLSHGLFVELQTAPQYAGVSLSGQQLTVSYSPDMVWNMNYGAYESDPVLLGPYTLSGFTYPANQIAEWQYIPDGVQMGGPTIDRSELAALTAAVRARLLWRPTNSTRIHIGWGESDYDVDVSTAAGQTEYQRILDQAAAVGCRNVLCDPSDKLLSNPSADTDSWGWESVLWLSLGQQIRTNAWYPGSNAVPASLQSLLNNAQADNLKLVAYTYPSLPFQQNPAWTAWSGNYADTGQRSFQDWWVQLATNYQNATGVGGFCFDYVLLGNGSAPSSPYAQWFGWRRILEQLRLQFPNDVIDGRQQFNSYGVWSWLACTYPHPITGDEQPTSFTCFPDLHWARVCADRQRWAAWWYRVQNLAPLEITPGYITQQTDRLDAADNYNKPGSPNSSNNFRVRDWDYLGWRYSVISTIGTAPYNLVVNYLPARDTNEFRAFSSANQQWMRSWFDWTDQNMDVLRHLQPIINQPQLGRVDGTAAFTNGCGFVFLFNPNYRALTARFKLDASIGLTNGGPFILRQLYPDTEKGKLILPPSGTVWNLADAVSLPLPGADALVLEITNISPVSQPLVLGVKGGAGFDGGQLTLTNVIGQVGTHSAIQVLMPAGQIVYSATVNGSAASFQQSNNAVSLSVNFAGTPFQRLQQIGSYDPNFMGGIYSTQIIIPSAVFQQLAARTNAWPVPYTADDLLATWLGSYRLLLFVNVANPSPSMSVSLTIDGRPVTLRPDYMTIYPLGWDNTFVGWYADLSALTPDVAHQFQLTLPPLAPGQFQGMFLDNVEAQFTNAVESMGTATSATLTASPNPSALGGNVTFTVSVQTNGQTAGDAGGSMVFLDNLAPLSTNVVLGGLASFFTSVLPAGTNSVTAAYSGNASYLACLSAPLAQVVQTIPSTPTNLTWKSSGASLTINWPSNHLGWILQVRTNPLDIGLRTNWLDIPSTAASTSITLPIFPGDPLILYRLRYPY